MRTLGISILLATAATSLYAGSITMDFSGIGPAYTVADYYNGGTNYTADNPGSPAAGPNYGVDFSNNGPDCLTSSACGGLWTSGLTNVPGGGGPPDGNFNAANEPNNPQNGNPVLTAIGVLPTGAPTNDIEMDVANGFTTLSFYYSDFTDANETVTLYNGNSVVGTMSLPTTYPPEGPVPDCVATTGQPYCNWVEETIPTIGGYGVATSAVFSGVPANYFFVTDVSIDECGSVGVGTNNCPSPPPPPPPGTPEPSTWLLFATGAGLMVFGSRKLKLRKNEADS